MSAPISAPAIDPMPPVATTANARTMTSTPMPSVTAIFGAITAPPIAPSPAPSRNVSEYTSVTLTPNAAAISRSKMTAVSKRP